MSEGSIFPRKKGWIPYNVGGINMPLEKNDEYLTM
jgi:hypothetical protein